MKLHWSDICLGLLWLIVILKISLYVFSDSDFHASATNILPAQQADQYADGYLEASTFKFGSLLIPTKVDTRLYMPIVSQLQGGVSVCSYRMQNPDLYDE